MIAARCHSIILMNNTYLWTYSSETSRETNYITWPYYSIPRGEHHTFCNYIPFSIILAGE